MNTDPEADDPGPARAPVEPLVETFLSHLQVERQVSQHTSDAYRRDLMRFRLDTNCDWREATTDHVRGWVRKRHGSGISPRTIARQLSALRTFFEFLVRRRIVPINPARHLRAPRVRPRLPDPLDADRTQQLIEHSAATTASAADGPTSIAVGWLETRDRAMLELFYSSGLRLAELVGLDIGDLREDRVRVLGKGRRQRDIPVGTKARSAIERWLHLRGTTQADEPMFTTRQGRRLQPRSVQLRLKKIGREALATDAVHPHMLRHSFASHVLESSGDLRAVQEMLGHAQLATTQVYTHLNFQHLAAVYDATHPRANLPVDSNLEHPSAAPATNQSTEKNSDPQESP